MKKALKVTLAVLSILTILLVVHCTALFNTSKKEGYIVESFLETNWQQMGGFNQYTPNQERIGCWGTAFAQILYHHRVKPEGEVSYTTSTGHFLNQDFDDYTFDFDLFSKELDEHTTQHSADQMAMYSYFAAAAIQKDFGTGQGSMLHGTKVGRALEAHYDVNTDWYVSFDGRYPYTAKKLEYIVEREVSSGWPVYFYFYDNGDKGHAVVIDGVHRRNGKFMVHIIQGQADDSNGWYDFHEGINVPEDTRLRLIYTVRPNQVMQAEI